MKYSTGIKYELYISDNYIDNNGNKEEGHAYGRIFGSEHPWFWRVHITALVSLGE